MLCGNRLAASRSTAWAEIKLEDAGSNFLVFASPQLQHFVYTEEAVSVIVKDTNATVSSTCIQTWTIFCEEIVAGFLMLETNCVSEAY